RKVDLFLFQDARAFGVGVDRARQRRAETRKVRAAVALGNVVGKAQRVFVIGVCPFHRHFDDDAVVVAADVDGRLVQDRLGAVDVGHIGGKAAFVVKLYFLGFGLTVVGQEQAHTGIE